MSRRSVFYALVIASLLATLTFPGASVVEQAVASPRPRNVSVQVPITTTTAPPTLPPVFARIATTEPVVFLTIDDGVHKAPEELPLLQASGLRATLFLTNSAIHRNPQFFVPFVAAGNPVENHTISHRAMSSLGYADQVAEICGEADLQQQQFGRRPTLFRPPEGAFNADTQRAAAACGMQAIVTWVATVDHGAIQYQLARHLRPGDIVLMHFRPEFARDLAAFVTAMRAAGLHTELLEDWLAPTATQRRVF
jgi:peptidoglycan/xylan/chitin deacetylase (PgdA/CDA1 family)